MVAAKRIAPDELIGPEPDVVGPGNRPALGNDRLVRNAERRAGFVRGLVVHVGESDVVPDGGAVGRVERAAARRVLLHLLVVGRVGNVLVEVMRVKVGDLIDWNLMRRKPLDRLAHGSAAETVRDEVQVAGVGLSLCWIDKAEAHQAVEQRVASTLRPAGAVFVGLGSPVPLDHEFRRVGAGDDGLVRPEVEPTEASVLGIVVVN